MASVRLSVPAGSIILCRYIDLGCCARPVASAIVRRTTEYASLSRVAEGQARRRHGNHATPAGAVRCQFLPRASNPGEDEDEPLTPVVPVQGVPLQRTALRGLQCHLCKAIFPAE